MAEFQIENLEAGIKYEDLNHDAPIIVFVEDSTRPIKKSMSNPKKIPVKLLKQDFIWRRNHPQPYKCEDIYEAIKAIEISGIKIGSIQYSRNAGCSECLCSPGYLVYTNIPLKSINDKRMVIHLKEQTKFTGRGAVMM